MTQDEVNELCGKRDDAACAMLVALKALEPIGDRDEPLARAYRHEIDQARAAIAQAEAAGITTE